MSPPLGSYSPTDNRAMVDFPQPDSPTSANVVPGRISNDTSSTACSQRRFSPLNIRCSNGRDTSKECETPTASSVLTSAIFVQPAGCQGGAGRHQLGLLHQAPVECARTAGMEPTAGRDGIQPRHRPVNLPQ